MAESNGRSCFRWLLPLGLSLALGAYHLIVIEQAPWACNYWEDAQQQYHRGLQMAHQLADRADEVAERVRPHLHAAYGSAQGAWEAAKEYDYRGTLDQGWASGRQLLNTYSPLRAGKTAAPPRQTAAPPRQTALVVSDPADHAVALTEAAETAPPPGETGLVVSDPADHAVAVVEEPGEVAVTDGVIHTHKAGSHTREAGVAGQGSPGVQASLLDSAKEYAMAAGAQAHLWGQAAWARARELWRTHPEYVIEGALAAALLVSLLWSLRPAKSDRNSLEDEDQLPARARVPLLHLGAVNLDALHSHSSWEDSGRTDRGPQQDWDKLRHAEVGGSTSTRAQSPRVARAVPSPARQRGRSPPHSGGRSPNRSPSRKSSGNSFESVSDLSNGHGLGAEEYARGRQEQYGAQDEGGARLQARVGYSAGHSAAQLAERVSPQGQRLSGAASMAMAGTNGLAAPALEVLRIPRNEDQSGRHGSPSGRSPGLPPRPAGHSYSNVYMDRMAQVADTSAWPTSQSTSDTDIGGSNRDRGGSAGSWLSNGSYDLQTGDGYTPPPDYKSLSAPTYQEQSIRDGTHAAAKRFLRSDTHSPGGSVSSEVSRSYQARSAPMSPSGPATNNRFSSTGGSRTLDQERILVRSQSKPEVLEGRRVLVAGYGQGVIKKRQRRPGRSSKFRVQFDDGTTADLPLQRSATKGTVPFTLL